MHFRKSASITTILILLLMTTWVAHAQIAPCDSTPNTQSPPGENITCNGDQSGVVNGSTGSDLVVVNGTVDGYVWTGGFSSNNAQSDTIINNGTVGDGQINGATLMSDDGLWGGAGSDTIVNNGTVNGGDYGSIFGDGSEGATDDDLIINNGTANGDINGDFTAGGDDTIVINGTVNGSVYGDASAEIIAAIIAQNGSYTGGGGNDLVILQDNAVVTGVIDGNLGYDTLQFAFQVQDWAEYQQLLAAIAAANPAGGEITYQGFTFTWLNFEQLVNLIEFIGQVQSGQITIKQLVEQWNSGDGRINGADAAAPAALYCQSGGVQVIDITDAGQAGESFTVSAEQIQTGVAQALSGGQNVMLAEGSGNSLWALTSNELQLHSGDYDFIFAVDRCAE